MVDIINSLFYFQQELVITVVACLVLLLAAFPQFFTFSVFTQILGSFFVLYSASSFFQLVAMESQSIMLFNGYFLTNVSLLAFKSLLMFLLGLVLLVGGNKHHAYGVDKPEFLVLILFSFLGVLLQIQANHFISLYLSLELSSLGLYVLAGMRTQDSFSAEASIKYFILGTLASCFLLFGASLVWGFSGGVGFFYSPTSDVPNLFHLSELVTKGELQNGIITIGYVLMIVAFAFKIALFPFHMWAPDVYQGSPFMSMIYFATLVKLGTVMVLFKFVTHAMGTYAITLQPFLVYLSVASIAFGSIMALIQTNLIRLLAFSSIVNAGFMVFAIQGNASEAYGVILSYAAIYGLTMIGLFSSLALLNKPSVHFNIDDLKGLNAKNKILAFMIMVYSLSLLGMPPFSGFIAKLLVIKIGIMNESFKPLIIVALGSAVAAYYYLKIIKVMYFDDSNPIAKSDKITGSMYVPALIFGLFVIVNVMIYKDMNYCSEVLSYLGSHLLIAN